MRVEGCGRKVWAAWKEGGSKGRRGGVGRRGGGVVRVAQAKEDRLEAGRCREGRVDRSSVGVGSEVR